MLRDNLDAAPIAARMTEARYVEDPEVPYDEYDIDLRVTVNADGASFGLNALPKRTLKDGRTVLAPVRLGIGRGGKSGSLTPAGETLVRQVIEACVAVIDERPVAAEPIEERIEDELPADEEVIR